MKCVHGGKTYEIRFRHIDNRFEDIRSKVDGRVLLRRERTKKEIRAAGGPARTSCAIFEVTGEGEGRKLDLLATATARLSPSDKLNWAHGRFYSLERALGEVLDGGLRRALRKAYYAQTAWRPDGRDGFKLQVRSTEAEGAVRRDLVPCHP